MGRVLLITEKLLGALPGAVMCASFCKLVRPQPTSVHPRFLLDYLRHLYNTGSIRQYQVQSTGISNFKFESFLDAHEVALPPIDVQRKIAAALSAYDELIENNLRRIEILGEMAQAVYREWFVEFRFPGSEDLEMRDSELGPIPESWSVSTFGDTFEILGGATPSTKRPEYWEGGELNWYTPSDLTGHDQMFISESSRKITEKGLAGCSATMFPAGSVMMTSRATLGVLAINTRPACTNQGFITCLPNKRISAYYLYHLLAEKDDVIQSMASGATFKEISKRNFRTIKFALPSSMLIESFTTVVSPMMRLTENLIAQNANLRTTRDLLLPKLVSGEIDMSDLDIDTEWLVA